MTSLLPLLCALLVLGLAAAAPAAARSLGEQRFEAVPPWQIASAAERSSGGLGGEPFGTSRQAIPLRSPNSALVDRRKAELQSGVGGAGSRGPLTQPRAALFNGLNQPGMAAGLLSGTPPDATGAIGPNHYVEVVNSVGFTAYDRNLNPVAGPVALEDFIGFPGDEVFDPQVQWDASWGRWIYTMVDSEGPLDNYIAFGWSKTADPTDLSAEPGGGWCGYFLYTGELLDDYPKLGHSNSGLTIGTNVFEEEFLGSRIWSIAKPASPSTCPEVEVAATGALFTEDGDLAFTPVPANAAGSTTRSYVVAADIPLEGAEEQIMVWHISGAAGGATLVEDGNVDVASYDIPTNVPQPGTEELLDASDARLTNAVSAVDPAVGKETIWTQHTVNGPGGRSVVRWYELLPATESPRQEGSISDPSHFVFNGAISPTAQGNAAAINFNRGSATLSPELHAQSRDSVTPLGQMGGDVLLGTSSGAAADFSCEIASLEPCRWGDYAGASPDPVQPGVVWGSNQGLAAPSGDAARWKTRNFALLADEHAPGAPTIAGTDPAGPANDNNPRVLGSAEAGSTVRVYLSADCSGSVAGSGTAAAFGSPGIAVAVSDNQTVSISATASDGGGTSPCSAPASYTERTPAIPKGQTRGIAIAAPVARVRRGRALVRLRCRGGGRCAGALRLVARARRSNLVIGRARFGIASGGAKLVRVPLTRKGRGLVRRFGGRRGLEVKLRGSGVRDRNLRLR